MSRKASVGISRRRFVALATGASLAAFGLLSGERRSEAAVSCFRWIMAEETFDASVGSDKELRDAMRGSACYVTGEGLRWGTVRLRSKYCRQYADVERTAAEVKAGTLLLDNVVWAIENGGGGDYPVNPEDQTEPEVQLDLGGYLRRARDLLYPLGITLIAAPAGNIRYAYLAANPDYEYTTLVQFMKDFNIPDKCARYADAYSIQAQQGEQAEEAYAEKVGRLAAAARRAEPDTVVMAGLTTNSPRERPEDYPTAQEIAEAALAVAQTVDGYWMNVPPDRVTGEKDYARAAEALRLIHGLSPAT